MTRRWNILAHSVAGQLLSLSPHLVSKWNCYTNCCPFSRADSFHWQLPCINNKKAWLFLSFGTNQLSNQFILPISIKSNQALSPTPDNKRQMVQISSWRILSPWGKNIARLGKSSSHNSSETWPAPELLGDPVQEGKLVPHTPLLLNLLPAWPVLWITIPDHSCDLLT